MTAEAWTLTLDYFTLSLCLPATSTEPQQSLNRALIGHVKKKAANLCQSSSHLPQQSLHGALIENVKGCALAYQPPECWCPLSWSFSFPFSFSFFSFSLYLSLPLCLSVCLSVCLFLSVCLSLCSARARARSLPSPLVRCHAGELFRRQSICQLLVYAALSYQNMRP